MNDETLQKIWSERYKIVPEQITKTSEIKLAATGFNTNIDAVVKIKGSKLSELAEKFDITLQTIKNCSSAIDSPNAAICGIIKCFIGGIAEEWLTSDISLDSWIENTFGTDKLQMGGQAGIIANVLALTYIKNIFVNTASHPKMLSEQFIKKENLTAIDENNKLAPAYKINRKNDMPPIHRIIEFDKGDTLTLGDKTYTCPKSNRFIATYDPLNAEMLINNTFKQYLLDNDFDYFIFAGYNLLSGEKGLKAAGKSAEFLQNLRKNSTILHLEIASTQDKAIRRYMLENIVPLCDSIGLNERETLEAAEVLLPDEWKKLKDKSLNVINLIETLLKIKEKTKVKRLQLHIFGLYLCLQDKDYKFSPPQSLSGMLCASVAAASKAQFGYLNSLKDLTLSLRNKNMKIYFEELQNLAQYLHKPELTENGFCEYQGYDLIAVPTILVDNPKTLVGMGDTISSLSLICAR